MSTARPGTRLPLSLRWALPALIAAGVCPAPAEAPQTDRASNRRDRLIIGVETAYPPYSFADAKGRPAGFNAELTRAVAHVAGLDVEIRIGPWDQIRKALETGKIDAICGMFYSAQREKLVDFTTPFAVIHHSVFVRRDGARYAGPADLKDRDLTVMQGDILDDWAVQQGLGDRLTRIPTQSQALQRLAAGEGDFVLAAKLPGLYWVRKLDLHGVLTTGPPLLASDYCFAVRQGDRQLQSRLQEALAILQTTGRLKELTRTWLGRYEHPDAHPGPAHVVNIGVLAKRGETRCRQMWGLTAEYLSKRVPGYEFNLVALPFHQIRQAVARREIDFVMVNPAIYVDLEQSFGVRRIVTLKNLFQDQAWSQFACLAITRADRTDIRDLRDLAGRHVLAVSARGFGGWLMLLRELEDLDIEIEDLARLDFAGTQDAVVHGVASGKAEVGVIRWNILADMAAEGQVDPARFRIVPHPDYGTADRPARSTRLYPEWPLAALSHVEDGLAEQVAAVLMRMDPQASAARAAGIHGWTVPQSYQSVHDCLKQLRVRPYDDYRTVSLAEALAQHWPWCLTGLGVLLAVLGLAGWAWRLNQALRRSLTGLRAAKTRTAAARDAAQQANVRYRQINARLEAAIARSETLAQRAERAARAKSEFLANMSHEIRTPLTAILGYADLLGDHHTDAAVREEQIRQIEVNGRHLLGLINDILDFSRIEAGQVEFDPSPCDLKALLREVAGMVRVQAEKKQLALQLDLDSAPTRRVMLDAHRLRQVLVNLVGNAIKFTKEGSVCLAARVEGDGENPDRVHIAVIDTGCGMQPETLERLGSPFTQADASTTRRHGGTGLGLAISYRLIEAMGGTIQVQSSPGMGTSFTLALDLQPARDDETEPDARIRTAGDQQTDLPREQLDLHGLRVLCAEDNKTNQQLIRTVLEQAGVEVRVVANGQLAIQVAAKHGFDAILMDMQMPVMDGYEATAQLRAAGCDLPIVALTAHALAGDREKCLRVGCDDYLTKPICRDKLLNILYRRTRRGSACQS